MAKDNEDFLFLKKIGEFVNISKNERHDLHNRVSSLKVKEAQFKQKEAAFEASLYKIAKALYETDFLFDSGDIEEFVKDASENPESLATMFKRVCDATDVSVMGKTASVAATKMVDDPIMRKAGLLGSSSSRID